MGLEPLLVCTGTPPDFYDQGYLCSSKLGELAIQADLGDFMGLVLDHCNEVSNTVSKS